MDMNYDFSPQWQQLRSTNSLQEKKYNNHKKCPNRGRTCFKVKSAHPSSTKSKPAYEYNLEQFPRLGETNSKDKKNNTRMGSSLGSIKNKKESCVSTKEIATDELEFMVQVLSEAKYNESEKDEKYIANGSIHPLKKSTNFNNIQKENGEISYNSLPVSFETDKTASQCKKKGKRKTIKKVSADNIKCFQDDNNNNSEKKIQYVMEEQNNNINEQFWTINSEPIITTV
ncbi:unnamed protein product, partial [Meganyctiphanes norvegica]